MKTKMMIYKLRHRKVVGHEIDFMASPIKMPYRFGDTRNRIRFSNVGDQSVSTIFLSIEHAFGNFFETAIFRKGGGIDVVRRAKTHRQALKCHLEVKAELKLKQKNQG